MKVLIILSIVYLQSQASPVTYQTEWKNSQGGHGAYIIKEIEDDPVNLKSDETPRALPQLPDELLTPTEKADKSPKEELSSMKKNDETQPESLDDEGPVSITGPISQFISQAAPSSSNSHLLASNTVTSHVPGSASGGGLSGYVPSTGTIPINSFVASNVPHVAQTGSLTGSLLPIGHITGGLLNGPLLHHIQGLLHHILGGHRPIIRPVHLSPGNVLIPGYSFTVGAGGITLPGVTRH